MDYYVKRHGRAFAIFDASNTRRSEELSREDATARKDALDAAERERQHTANDARTIAWTARRYTAVEWYELLAGDRAALKKAVRKLWSAATPCRFTVRDAYSVAADHEINLSKHMRRQIKENWEGDVAQRLEQYDQRSLLSKSAPYVLAALLGTERVPRLRRKLDDAIKSDEDYRRYRALTPQWLGFPAMEKALAQQKKNRDMKPAGNGRRRVGKSTHDQVRRLTRAKMSQADIAEKLKIDVRTVRRHQKPDKSSG